MADKVDSADDLAGLASDVVPASQFVDPNPDLVATRDEAGSPAAESAAPVPASAGPTDQTIGTSQLGEIPPPRSPPDDLASAASGLSSSRPTDSSLRHVVVGSLPAGSPGTHSRYSATHLHAEGGLGRVWITYDSDLNREVVLKEIRPEHDQSHDVERRFLREAQVTGQLEHPNIVPIYELGWRKGGRPYYTMRFVRGNTLRDAIRAYHDPARALPADPLELPRLLQSFLSVCHAIGYAHARGVVHRDIKPANVVLGEFGEVLVLDWGLAKLAGASELPMVADLAAADFDVEGPPDERTHHGQVLGTLGYMAPEQALGEQDHIDGRTDIYALGSVLYEILTNRPPHQGSTTRELLKMIERGAVPPAAEVDPRVPRALSAICVKAMAHEQSDRYQTTAELATDIERWLVDEPVSVFRDPPAKRAARWARKHRSTCVATAAVLLVTCVAVGAWRIADARRVGRLRSEARWLMASAHQALARNDLADARVQLARAESIAGESPVLAELAEDAHGLLVDVEARTARAAARVAAQDDFARFRQLRDEALFRTTLLTGLDPLANRAAARQAAEAARAIFPLSKAGTFEDPRRHDLSTEQAAAVERGERELVLLLARSMSDAPPGQKPQPEDVRSALALLDTARPWADSTQSFHLLRAACLASLGDAAESTVEQQQAERLAPATAQDHFLIADEAFRRRQFGRAIEQFQEVLRLEPDHFWAHYFLAICRLRQGQPRLAIENLAVAISWRPDFGWTYMLRAQALIGLGNYDAAADDLRRAQELGVDEYSLLVNRGALWTQAERYADARRDLARAVALRPELSLAHVNLAELYRRQQEFPQALAEATTATQSADWSPAPYRIRAQVRLETGDLVEALADIDRAIELEAPASRELGEDLKLRGGVLVNSGRYAEAVESFEQARTYTDHDPLLDKLLAEAQLKLGHAAEAKTALDRYLHRPEDDGEALRQRGLERAKLGDPAGALADYTQSLELEPDSTATRARRGWALLNAPRIALDDFESGLKADPDNAELHAGRGYALAQLGKYREAVAAAREALEHERAQTPLNQRLALRVNVACIYAQAQAKAAGDLAAADHEALARDYAERALEQLKAAAELLPAETRRGYLQQALADPSFEVLRRQPAFAALVK